MATATLAARPAPLVTALAGLVTLGIAIGPGRFGFTPILPRKRRRRRPDRGGRPRVRRLYGPVALVELLHNLSIHDLIFVLILSNGPRSSNTSEA
jgi:hypothetical protein